ncbi:MAG: SLBB domain-containing protein [Acidobacteriota bacterium]|nr:SLBB domain-containing protein [Acidobacteriota bacterium]
MENVSANPAMPHGMAAQHASSAGGAVTSASLRGLLDIVRIRRRSFLTVLGLCLLACLAYCVFGPRLYEARARVALRATTEVPLSINGASDGHAVSGTMSEVELETLASVLRSERLAWRVIKEQKLYTQPDFAGPFSTRYRNFNPDQPDPTAQAWLIKRFCRRLRVTTVPRTLVVEIRFRTADAILSADIVNALIQAYNEQDTENRLKATAAATQWLYEQLASLKSTVDHDDEQLAQFQKDHKLIYAPVNGANGMTDQVQHSAIVQGIDTLGQQLVDATAERIRRDSEYRAAVKGDPEMVVAADPALANDGAGFGAAILHQLHTQRSTLQQELAQLNLDHGPNFPRTLEIGSQIADIDAQIKTEKGRIITRLRAAMIAAQNRESLLRASLQSSTSAGLVQNQAAAQFAVMRQEAESRRAVYLQTLQKAREAGMQAGIEQSNLSIVDPAYPPVDPVTPNPPLDFAITLFVGFWLALGWVLFAEAFHPSPKFASYLLAIAVVAPLVPSAQSTAHAQAPTPSTSGLPTGVARMPQSTERRVTPNPKESPVVWPTSGPAERSGVPSNAAVLGAALPAPLSSGDMIVVNEVNEPMVHTVARVSDEGTASIPLAGDVKVAGLNETGAARAIEAALIAKGMLKHPQVTVLVTSYVGQDVSILGEVQRPGVYPYTAHHRLLDFIAAAQGLAHTAGSLVTVTPRDPDAKSIAVELHEADAGGEHNPELRPGDTVQVNKAGLVYVVGDVMRPGGFAVDPAQHVTVVQAITLAWGPTQNAALGKALLIRDEKGGRMVTQLDLKRMLRGQDPDLPIHDRDIIFVPDSMARNLLNRTMESVIQSAAGVSIYAGLVYSQRF